MLARPACAALLVSSATLGVVGCAPTAAQKAEAELASVRKENDAKTLVARGRAFAAVGDPTRAEEYLAAALDAGAEPRDVLPLLIDVCVKTGRYRSAIQHGENHLRKHPNDLRTRVMVGALYAAISESKHARANLEPVAGPLPEEPYEVTEASAEAEPPAGPAPAAEPPRGREAPEALKAEAHYLLAIVARDTDNDVVMADRHFRAYLRIEPSGSHAEEAKASLLKRMP